MKTRLEHNVKMENFLKSNGFVNAVPWRIDKGSMRGCWRIYSKQGRGWNNIDKWTPDIADKFNKLGFVGFDGKPLNQLSGTGGVFHIFVMFKEV